MKYKRMVCLLSVLIFVGNSLAQSGYRDIQWGSTKLSARKMAIGYFGDRYLETESKLIFNSPFQGNDAVYTFFFTDDSLHTVTIKSELPYALSDEKKFSENFEKSEKAIDDLTMRINGKYGRPVLDEQVGTDLFLRWEDGDTEIELFVQRSFKYKILMSYRWIPFFERRKEVKIQQYQNEL
jgi:hypothetical protein